MTLHRVKTSLAEISKYLDKTQRTREDLIKSTREIIVLSSKAISAIHQTDLKTATKNTKRAESLIKRLRKRATGDLARYMLVPEQEYVEAMALLAIVQNNTIPSRKDLDISEEAYVLGLLDCVGELKRMILDQLRRDESTSAMKTFDIMEALYQELYHFSIYDKVLKDARRKIDVNRSLVESIRSTITEEVRRSKFIDKFSAGDGI